MGFEGEAQKCLTPNIASHQFTEGDFFFMERSSFEGRSFESWTMSIGHLKCHILVEERRGNNGIQQLI